jgi:hypothetical protein
VDIIRLARSPTAVNADRANLLPLPLLLAPLGDVDPLDGGNRNATTPTPLPLLPDDVGLHGAGT